MEGARCDRGGEKSIGRLDRGAILLFICPCLSCGSRVQQSEQLFRKHNTLDMPNSTMAHFSISKAHISSIFQLMVVLSSPPSLEYLLLAHQTSSIM